MFYVINLFLSMNKTDKIKYDLPADLKKIVKTLINFIQPSSINPYPFLTHKYCFQNISGTLIDTVNLIILPYYLLIKAEETLFDEDLFSKHVPRQTLGSTLSISKPSRQEQKYDVFVSVQNCWQCPL